MKKVLLLIRTFVLCCLCLYTSRTLSQNYDAGVVSIEPLTAVCPGNHPVAVTIENYGDQLLDTIILNWSVDGVFQSSMIYHSPLDTNQGSNPSSALVTLGNYSFIGNQNYAIKAWTSLPAQHTDVQPDNDTASAVLTIPASPGGLSVFNISTTAADISFATSSSALYSLIYGPKGFDPLAGGTNISDIDSPYNLSGLSPGTAYDLYLYADCSGSAGPPNDYTDTTGPFTFQTPCITQSLPYIENFDNGLGCFIAINGGSSAETWVHVPAGGVPTFPGYELYAMTEINPATFSFGDSFDEILLSPAIEADNIISGQDIILEFDQFLTSFAGGPDSGRVDVYDGSQWNTVYSIIDENVGDFNNPPTPDHQTINITDYKDENMQIRFVYKKGLSEVGIWVIDNVSVTKISCLRPLTVDITTITDQSVNVQLNGEVINFGYEIDTTGFTSGTGRITGTAFNPGTINGLNPATSYDIYVRADCDTSGLSNWIGPFTFKTRCSIAEQLSGIYTIDATQSTGGNNFGSFTEAARALRNCGIKGPVVFNVTRGTFNDSLFLNDIAGVSSVNTITFRGEGADSTFLTTSFDQTPVVHFNGTDHVTLKNMTISSSSYTGARGVVLQNSADHITIDSCHIIMSQDGDGNMISSVYGILASSNPSSSFGTGPGDNADYLTVSNCSITGGQMGIRLNGDNTGGPDNTGHIIQNNVLGYHNSYAININYLNEPLIKGNIISNLINSTADGVHLNEVSNYTIWGNTIISGSHSLNITKSSIPNGSITIRSQITNNMIISTNTTRDGGMYIESDNTDVFHNSVTGFIAIEIHDVTNIDIRNNIFYSSYFAFVSNSTGSGNNVDYNLYYTDHIALCEIGGISYTDLQAWQNADNISNMHSHEGDPKFLFPFFDLHTFGAYAHNNGDPSMGVTEDIDGEVRSVTAPDIGADEFIVSCPEIAGFFVDSQTYADGEGTFTFSFDRDNEEYRMEMGPCGFTQGTGTIDTSAMAPITITGLDPNTCYDIYVQRDCDSAQSGWAGPFTLTARCPDSLKLSGAYTIDAGQASGGSNFNSFREAVAALNCGIKGPVEFVVAPGTYRENIMLEEVFGAAPDSTITFRGSGPSTVLEYTSSDGTPAIHLKGADYIRFRDMTISVNAAGNNHAWGVLLQNVADHNIIDNCRIKMPQGSNNVYGIATNGSITSPYTYRDNANYLTISNCIITGGRSGISLFGDNNELTNTGHIVNNNVCRHQYRYGINATYIHNVKIRNNDIDSVVLSQLIGRYGIYLEYTNDFVISGNKIITSHSSITGIEIFRGNYSGASERSLVVNNMIISPARSGLNLDFSSEIDVYHNSIIGSPAIFLRSHLNMDIRNNILSSVTGNKAFISEDRLTGGDVIDYNLYYNSASGGTTSMFDIEGVSYTDLMAWRLADAARNIHSLKDNPSFVDPSSDLHIIYSRAYGKGDPSAGITEDIDGETRSSTAPTIGADEFTLPPCIPSDNLNVVTVHTASVLLSWDPGAGDTYNLWYGPSGFFKDSTMAGTKITGITDTFYTVTGLSPQTAYDIYISDNCGDTAGSVVVDTSIWHNPVSVRTFCTGQLPGGTYTIDSSQPTGGTNFNSFSEAAITLSSCGISGPVVFNILPGSYDSGILEEISGVSAANTVTFRGAGPSLTTITSSTSELPAVHLNGADHVSFENLTISHTGLANTSWGLLLQNSSNYITIDSCRIEISANGGAGIVASNSTSLTSGYGDNANYVTISNCRVSGGANGIYLTGNNVSTPTNLGHVIRNNTIRHTNTGLYVRYISSPRISHNDIDSVSTYGMYIYYTSDYRVSGNRIHAESNYGLYVDRGNYNISTTNRSLITNNMISSGNNSGLYFRYSEKTDIFHNSITGFPSLELENQSDIAIRNNIFYSATDLAFEAVSFSAGDIVDHNLYHGGTFIANIGGINYGNLSAWQSADGTRNVNSLKGDPDFVSQNNMHIRNTSIALDAGYPFTGVTEDIDGDSRPSPNSFGVDIGADEYFISCALSDDLSIDSLFCNRVVLNWTPDASGAFSIIEYDTSGFIPGTGNRISGSAPLTLSGLTINTSYEIYLSDTCGTDTFEVAGPIPFTTPSGPINTLFNFTIDPATATGQTVNFDASPSSGATYYEWDFGDGNTATGKIATHNYAANGNYNVQLVIGGDCGDDTLTQTVQINGISLGENLIGSSLEVYPNPTTGKVQIHFKTGDSKDIIILLTDMSGRVILRRLVSDVNGSYVGETDLSQMAKGAYLLRVGNSEKEIIKRVIKQ